jgi:hypothetical protein
MRHPKTVDKEAERIALIDAALDHLRHTRDEGVRLIRRLEKQRAAHKTKVRANEGR